MRGFSLRSAFSLAFADVSPIVALYAIFTLGLFAAARFFWAFPIVLIGQLPVAAVFGELSSRGPFAGSVYQWARHVRGTTGVGSGLGLHVGSDHRPVHTVLRSRRIPAGGLRRRRTWAVDHRMVALVIIAIGTATNMIGRQVLKVMVIASITCEIVGSVGLGIVLLMFFAKTPSPRCWTTVPTRPHGPRGQCCWPLPTRAGRSLGSRPPVRLRRKSTNPPATFRRPSSAACSASGSS